MMNNQIMAEGNGLILKTMSMCRVIFGDFDFEMLSVPFLRSLALNVSIPQSLLIVSGSGAQIGSLQFAGIVHCPRTQYIVVYQLPYLTSFL